jgi:hypothetical protein
MTNVQALLKAPHNSGIPDAARFKAASILPASRPQLKPPKTF